MIGDMVRTWPPDDSWQVAQPLIPAFGVSRATAHRRFSGCPRAGLRVQPHQRFPDRLGAIGEVDWARAVVGSINVRVEKGGTVQGQTRSTRANPNRRSTSRATARTYP